MEDGWDEVEQLADLTDAWKAHVLALDPNGGQRRNLERLIQRVEAGPLEERPPKKRRHEEEEVEPGPVATAAQSEPAKEEDERPSGSTSATAQPAAGPSSSQVHSCFYFGGFGSQGSLRFPACGKVYRTSGMKVF